MMLWWLRLLRIGAILSAGLLFFATYGFAKSDYFGGQKEVNDFIFFDTRTALPEHQPLLAKDGQAYHLDDFKGAKLLVNFWAEWCRPCMHEIPSLHALQNAYDVSELRVLLVDVNAGGRQAGDRFLADRNFTNLLNVYDGGRGLSQKMPSQSLPLNVLVDSRGLMFGYLRGGVDWTRADFRELIEEMDR